MICHVYLPRLSTCDDLGNAEGIRESSMSARCTETCLKGFNFS
jgi:hypothetical protein